MLYHLRHFSMWAFPVRTLCRSTDGLVFDFGSGNDLNRANSAASNCAFKHVNFADSFWGLLFHTCWLPSHE